jgi:endonuclease YncB( thermonuclease family)
MITYCLPIIISSPAQASQDEIFGIVTNVVDGDTFDVTIEKTDPRISNRVERVRLADIDSPEIDTAQGPGARDFTFAVLMNKRVYLDIDDLSGSGRDNYGRLICVAYLTGIYGQPLSSPNFNRLLVDMGQAKLENFTNNEFDPRNWWSVQSLQPSIDQPAVGPLQGLPQKMQSDLLPRIQDSAEKELDLVANDAWNWLKGQIIVNFK